MQEPTREDWQRREDLLDELLELPESEQAGFIEQVARASAGDAASLREWLAGIERSEGYLAAPAPVPIGRDGAAVGNWRALRLIGRGGMGEVWLGERADGLFEKRVAIKFIRDDRPQLKRSLESERRVLAALQHPGIVRLLDAGATADGHPFLVTEYIDGVALDAWLERDRPALAQRLRLFREVAEAVAYAHERLVIHSDIKPANILVDADAHAHLLDFGIARALADEGDAAHATQIALTPEFAAPELIADNSAGMRSDVYALGGLLYFLLCGKPPLALRGLALAAMIAKVRDEQPARPSATAAPIAGAPKRLLADLDAIALKALAKAPAARYGTVEALLADLDAALASRPLAARAPNTLDHALRYLRRHRLALAIAATVALSLIAGMAGTLWQAREARLQRDRAEAEAQRAGAEAATANAVRDFLVGVFKSANPELTYGKTPTAAELIDGAVREARDDLRERPELQAQLFDVLGQTYAGLGRYAQSVALLREAHAAAVATTGETSPLALRLAVDFAAAVNSNRGPYDEAQALLERTLARLRGESPQNARLLIAALYEYGEMQSKRGDLNLAIGSFEQALAQAKEMGRDGDEERATVLKALAAAKTMQSDYPAAIGLLREALDIRKRLSAPGSPPIVDIQIELADVLRAFDRLDESAAMLRQAVAAYRDAFGDKHPRTLYARVQLAETLTSQRELGEAETLLRGVDADARQQLGSDNELSRRSLNGLAGIRNEERDGEGGLVFMREAVEMSTRLYGADSPKTLSMSFNLANAYLNVGDFADAEALSRKVLDKYRATGNDDIGGLLSNLAYTARMRGDAEEATKYRAEALTLLQKQTGASSTASLAGKLALALDQRNLGRLDDARRNAEAVRDETERLGKEADARLRMLAHYAVAQIDYLQGRCADSRSALETAWEQYGKLKDAPPNRVKTATAALFVGLCRKQTGSGDGAATRAMIAENAKILRESKFTDPYIRHLADQAARAK